MEKLKPLLNNVIVMPLEEEQITASGIIIPDTASKEKPMKGKVLAVGPGKRDDKGTLHEVGVVEGDIVIFSRYAPTEVKLNGKEIFVMGSDSILAIIENSN